jgi:ABC-type antimicrobial peptide transport system permease subunit
LSGEHVVIVNETLARSTWGTEDPIGRRICWGIECGKANQQLKTIIGVVGDMKQSGLSGEAMAEVFEPFLQATKMEPEPGDDMNAWFGPRQLTAIVRGEASPDDLIGGLRRAVRAIDPSLPLTDAQPLEAMLQESITPQRFSAQLLGVFALTAVLLAALGLYGLLASFVTQRTREIGVRVALGAQPGDVVGLIVRQGLTLVAIGLVIGLAGALVATQSMKSVLFGVQPFDPLTFASVAAALAAIGAIASLLPAWRAARVDPVRALRGE